MFLIGTTRNENMTDLQELGQYEEKLKVQRMCTNESEVLRICKALIEAYKELRIIDKGQFPDPLRYPGKGKRGELWFRNRLLWLRTIPLSNNASFIITHGEAAVYYDFDRHGKGKKASADCLGIWRKAGSTKLCIAELKAGKGDNIAYALMEGARNAYLHLKAKKRLADGWRKYVENAKRNSRGGKFWKLVWGNASPFPMKKLKDVHLLIIGDNVWIQDQKKWGSVVLKIIKLIKKEFGMTVAIYSLNRIAKPLSKAYVMVPLERKFER